MLALRFRCLSNRSIILRCFHSPEVNVIGSEPDHTSNEYRVREHALIRLADAVDLHMQ